jgi:hypothetical protein
MALSGSFTTTKYDGRYYEFSWSATQSTDNNTSTISWSLEAKGGSYGYYVERAVEVVIDGSTEFSKTNAVNRYKGVVASGTKVITHNTDGSRSFSASVKAQTYYSSYNNTGSDNWELDDIPRGAVLKTSPNFNDEENPTITYENYLGDKSNVTIEACISFTGSLDDIPYREISKTGTSYTFNLTEEERATLRNGVTNGYSREVIFYVKTFVDGKVYYSTQTKTLTLINAEPSMSTPTVINASPELAGLTGNNPLRFIYGESNVHYDFKAAGRKGATISSYRVKCGAYESTSTSGIIYNILPSYNEHYITFTATDSRGNSVSTQVPIETVWYLPPECYLEEDSLSTSSGHLHFNVRCYWLDGYFDGTSTGADGGVKNEAALQYRYRLEDEEEYGEWFDADPIGISYDPENYIENNFNEYMWNVAIGGLDYTSTYKIQLRLMDKVITSDKAVITGEYTMRMIPVFDWSREDFNVNVPTRLNDGLYLLNSEGGYSQVMKYAKIDDGMGYVKGTGLDIGYENFEKGLEAEEAGVAHSEVGWEYDTNLLGNNVKLTSCQDLYLSATYGQIKINQQPLADFVIEQGSSGSWYYRKWDSGIVEMWGWCEALYADTHYLSTYQPFPVTLYGGWISATGTVNGFSGNLTAYLGVNVKIECNNYGCNVWVQNPADNFSSGTSTGVSIHVLGRWRSY